MKKFEPIHREANYQVVEYSPIAAERRFVIERDCGNGEFEIVAATNREVRAYNAMMRLAKGMATEEEVIARL